MWKSWLFSVTLRPGAFSQALQLGNRYKFAGAKVKVFPHLEA
jgi:hypothetical protein